LEGPPVFQNNSNALLYIYANSDDNGNWGGAQLWASTDNVNYNYIDDVTTPGRFGTIGSLLPAATTPALDTNSLIVNMNSGQLLGTSASGFQNNVTEAAIFSTTPVSATQPVTLPYNQTGVTTDLLACKNLVPSSSNRNGTWSTSGAIIYSSANAALVSPEFGMWAYTGTGSPSGAQFVTSPTFTLTKGVTYTLSCYANGTHITSGNAFLGVEDSGITTLFGSASITSSTNGRVTATFTISGSGTQACKFILDTANCTVTSGQQLVFANPQVEAAASASTYEASDGLDGNGNSISFNTLGMQLTYAGSPFDFNPPDAANCVAALGQVVNLPSGKFNVLTFVGTSVDSAAGSQSQNFTVKYSDTSTQTLTFSLSDWTAPENYPNEYAVQSLPHGNTVSTGASNAPIRYLYAYSAEINNAKTVSTITLPNNVNVKIFAMAVTNNEDASNLEFVSYQNATLTGQLQYTLTPLHRGLYNTSNVQHASGETFVRLDEASYEYEYNPKLVGQTLFLKALSYNTFGNKLQNIANVTPVQFQIQGYGSPAIDAVTGTFTNGADSVPNGAFNFSRTAAHSSYRPTSNPLTGHDAGSNATINIASFAMRSPGFPDINVNSGSITGLAYSTLYYIFYSDLYAAGGAVSYQDSLTKEVALQSNANWFVGSVITPPATGADTIGNNDGGSGGQFGSGKTVFFSTLPQSSGAITTGNGAISNWQAWTGGLIATNNFGTLSASGNSANNQATLFGGFVPGVIDRNATATLFIYFSIPTNTLPNPSGGVVVDFGYNFNSGSSAGVSQFFGPTFVGGQTAGPTIISTTVPITRALSMIQPFIQVSTFSNQGSGTISVNAFQVWMEINS